MDFMIFPHLDALDGDQYGVNTYLVPFPTWPELGPGCWNSCGFDYSVGYGDGYNVGDDLHRRANRRANETW